MRRIFSFMVATVDGYYEGPNQEFDWPIVDDEFNRFAVEQLDEVDTLLFGASLIRGWRRTGRRLRRSKTTPRSRRG